MNLFKGFGLLLKNEKGEWTINDEVVETGEEIILDCWDEDSNLREPYVLSRVNIDTVKTSMLWGVTAKYDDGTGPWGTPNNRHVLGFRARRLFSVMAD